MNKLARGLFLTVALLLMSLSVSFAGVIVTPTGIPYQGRLTDAAGAPVNGARDLTLALYNSGGGLLYSETQSAVTVTNGLFSVEVGTGTPVGGPFSAVNFTTYDVFLGIAVGADPEMTPRIHLGIAPYSMTAKDSPGLASNHAATVNFTASGSVALSGTTITVPTSGFVFVIAGGQVYGPASFFAQMWISTTPAGAVDFGDYGDISVAAAGSQYIQYERHKVYSVAPGTYQFYLNGAGNNASAYLWQPTCTAIFIPRLMGDANLVPTTANSVAQPGEPAR